MTNNTDVLRSLRRAEKSKERIMAETGLSNAEVGYALSQLMEQGKVTRCGLRYKEIDHALTIYPATDSHHGVWGRAPRARC